MVFFQCDSCGEALKKAKVESHRYQCRNSSVSCIDCNKVFSGNAYNQHSTCVSEAERYQGQLYKGVSNKQARKQEQQQGWLNNVREALDSASGVDGKTRDVLNRMVAYDNIPRKKAKFENFCRNSLAVRDESIIQRIWNDYINPASAATAPAPAAVNGSESKPEAAAEAVEESAAAPVPQKRAAEPVEAKPSKKQKKDKKEKGKFDFAGKISKAIKKAKGEGVDSKKLQKKLLKKYLAESGEGSAARGEKAWAKALKAFVVHDGKIVSALAA